MATGEGKDGCLDRTCRSEMTLYTSGYCLGQVKEVHLRAKRPQVADHSIREFVQV